MRHHLATLALLAALAGCDAGQQGDADADANAAPAPAADASTVAMAPTEDVMQKWSRSCVLCHVDGNGGAPRLGNAGEWQPRLAKGKDVLLQHTLEGLNNMPPLGYCMSCERDDFIALIEFMSEGN
ncbi:MAG: c-type cytochrome [Pseudomonadales bacterium]